MTPGALDEKLTARVRTETTVRGVTSASYADAGSVWASVREESARERLRAGRVEATRGAVVTVRWPEAARLDAATAAGTLRFVRSDGTALDAVGDAREVRASGAGRRQWAEYLCTES